MTDYKDTLNLPQTAFAMKADLARILKQEGYISDFVVSGEGAAKSLRLRLKYVRKGEPVVKVRRRISRPGLRRGGRCPGRVSRRGVLCPGQLAVC